MAITEEKAIHIDDTRCDVPTISWTAINVLPSCNVSHRDEQECSTRATDEDEARQGWERAQHRKRSVQAMDSLHGKTKCVEVAHLRSENVRLEMQVNRQGGPMKRLQRKLTNHRTRIRSLKKGIRAEQDADASLSETDDWFTPMDQGLPRFSNTAADSKTRVAGTQQPSEEAQISNVALPKQEEEKRRRKKKLSKQRRRNTYDKNAFQELCQAYERKCDAIPQPTCAHKNEAAVAATGCRSRLCAACYREAANALVSRWAVSRCPFCDRVCALVFFGKDD